MPISLTATDAEIKSAAKQLGLNGAGLNGAHLNSSPRNRWANRKPRVSQVLQRLAHGRSHTVAVEIKPSSRRLAGAL